MIRLGAIGIFAALRAMQRSVLVVGDDPRAGDDPPLERKRVAVIENYEPKPKVHAQTREAARRARQMARKASKDERQSTP